MPTIAPDVLKEAKTKPAILIEVRGGTVVAVFAEEGQKVLLLDWDEVEAGEPNYRAGEYPTSTWTELPDDSKANSIAKDSD